MKNRLILIENRLNVLIGMAEVLDIPPRGAASIQMDREPGVNEEESKMEEDRSPYNGPWKNEDSKRLGEFNVLIREANQIKLGMLIKHKGKIIQVYEIYQKNIFDCREFGKNKTIRVSVKNELYTANPPMIRNFFKLRNASMENYTDFGPNRYQPYQR